MTNISKFMPKFGNVENKKQKTKQELKRAPSIFQIFLFHQEVPSLDRRLQVNFPCQAILFSGKKRLFLSFSSKYDKIHKVPKEKKERRDRERVVLLTFSGYRVGGQSKTDAFPQAAQWYSWCALPWFTLQGWVIGYSVWGRTDLGSDCELVPFGTADI